MTTKLVEFQVRGAGQFPFDMLRYDHAFPESERDSALLAGSPDAPQRTVTLLAIVNGRDVPSVERWGTFLWHVVVGSVRKVR